MIVVKANREYKVDDKDVKKHLEDGYKVLEKQGDKYYEPTLKKDTDEEVYKIQVEEDEKEKSEEVVGQYEKKVVKATKKETAKK